jgi:energy-coupling factor transporter ATP-binding protein EcfA2
MREEIKQVNLGQKLINLISKYFVMDERDKRKVLYHVASSHLKFTHWGQLLMILAPESGCGKTNLRDMIAGLVPHGVKCVDPSGAAIYTLLTEGRDLGIQYHPIIGEIGKYYNGKRDTSLLTTIISAGMKPGDPVRRTQFVDGKRSVEVLETFGNKVLCGIRNEKEGFFPNDFWRRAHVINLVMKDTSHLDKYITRAVERECAELKKEFEEWVKPRREIAQALEPIWLPFSGSLYDKTETLYTTGLMLDFTDEELKITDFTSFTGFAGTRGVWSQQVVDDATEELQETEDNREESDGIQLIRDCITAVDSQTEYGFFGDNTCVPTTAKGNQVGGWALYDAVLALPESPWSTYNFGHKPITITEFCKMLKIRGVKRPRNNVVTIKGHAVRGWDLSAFIDPAWDWCKIKIEDVSGVRPVSEVIPATDLTPVTETDGGVSSSLSISPSTPTKTTEGGIPIDKPTQEHCNELVETFAKYNGRGPTLEEYRELRSREKKQEDKPATV